MNSRSLICACGMVAIAFASPGLEGQETMQAASCSGSWSASIPMLRSGARPVFVDRGVLAPFGSTMIALGSPTLFWLGPTHPVPRDIADTTDLVWSLTRSGALVANTGLADGVPWADSLRRRSKPRLLGWSENSIQVLWQSIDSVAPIAQSGYPNRLEVASFDGQRWSASEIITREKHLPEVDVPAMRAVTPFRHSVIALSVVDSGSFVRVWRRTDSRWIRTQLRLKSFGFHASAAELSDGATLVVFTQSIDSEGILNANGSRSIPVGVFSARIQWNGDSAIWSAAKLIDTVHAVGGFRAFATARMGADTMVVAWYQSTADESKRNIATALTADGGNTWSLAKPLAVSGQVHNERLAVDSRGRLHLVYSASSNHSLGAPGPTTHALWQQGEWLTPTIVTAADVGLQSASGTKDGKLIAMWSDFIMSPDGALPRSYFAIWTPSSGPNCQRAP